MLRKLLLGTLLALATHAAHADDAAEPVSAPPAAKEQPDTKKEPTKPEGDVKMSGMSVLGNEETPKSLVIVPWKSSQLGDMPGLSKLLDDSTQPVDKEVFMRELAYYQIKVDSK